MLHTFTTFAGRNLNLSALARENGLRRAHLHHIFNFRRTPSLLYAIRLSRALGMTLDEFVAALARRRFELRGNDSDGSGIAVLQPAPAHEEGALASPDKTIHLWDAVRGQHTRTLQDGQDTLTSVAWSPDGRMLASAGSDKTIRLWEVASGQLVLTLQGHRSVISTIAWNPEGRALASGDLDGVVRLWEAASGSLIRSLPVRQRISTVAWSPDGRILASAGSDGSIRLWEVASGTLIHRLRSNRNLPAFASNADGDPVFEYRRPGPGT